MDEPQEPQYFPPWMRLNVWHTAEDRLVEALELTDAAWAQLHRIQEARSLGRVIRQYSRRNGPHWAGESGEVIK